MIKKQIANIYLIAGVIVLVCGFVFSAFDLLYSLIASSLLLLGMLPKITKSEVSSIYISRIFVGALFVVSGLIKANDPLGFSYKLEEYFTESALGWTFFEPYSLGISILVSSSEIILGFAVLFGGKSKLATWALLGMTLFFAWLTYYTAQCDPQGTYTVLENGVEVQKGVTCVTDCGCFGDALKGSIGRSLVPWESFKKDALLFVYVLILLIFNDRISLNSKKEDSIILPAALLFVAGFGGGLFGWWFPLLFTVVTMALYLVVKNYSPLEWDKDWQVALVSVLLSFGFTFYCYSNLPQKDFRPYAIGKNLSEQMKIPEGAEPDVFKTILTYKDTTNNEEFQFTQAEYMAGKKWENKKLKWISTETELIKRGFEPSITDFQIMGDDGNDYTEDILAEPILFLLVSYDITHANGDCQNKVNELVKAVNTAGYPFYGLTASLYNDVEIFRHEHQNMFDYYTADGTVLKTIIRSNPGLLLLKNGTVIGKWHYNNLPTFEELKNKELK